MFLEDLGLMQAFEQVSLAGKKRMLVPTVQFVLLSLLKGLFGAESMNELARVLFSDLGLMELVGFNAQQCEEGLTKRGDAQRTTKKKQGPLSAQCLPLAMKLVKIQEYEGKWLLPLLEQAQVHLGLSAHIGTVVMDRGYLDGEDLWAVHQKGVICVICGCRCAGASQRRASSGA